MPSSSGVLTCREKSTIFLWYGVIKIFTPLTNI